MSDAYPPEADQTASDLAGSTNAVQRERTPCPGQPRVITGSNWLQERDKPSGYKGSKRYGAKRSYPSNPFRKRQGLAGERYVLERMLASLDGCWVIYTNLELFIQQGDIDMALVGPGGVIAVEVKTLSRDLVVAYDEWLIFEKGVPQAYSAQPSAQAKDNAFKMQIYLEHYGVSYITVRPIVVIASDAHVSVHASEVEIWCRKDLDNELSQLNRYELWIPEEIAQIVAVLTKHQN
jgi:hypothetical protein